MTPDHEAAEAVNGLSDKQRYAVLYGQCAKESGPRDCICDAEYENLPAELFGVRSRIKGGDGAIFLTPFGLRVRAVLQGEGK